MFAIPAGLALVLAGLGAMFIGIDRHEVAVGTRMHSWPSTTATITESHLRDQRQPDGRWSHYGDTTFRYAVAGHSYEFTTSEYAGLGTADNGLPPRNDANQLVRVFYDPADPSQGSLTNTRPPPSIMFVVMGAVCFALSLPFWYLSARMFRRRPKASPGANS